MNWYLKALKKYAVFSGRAQRAEFWYFILFSIIVSILLTVVDIMLGLYNPKSGMGVLSGIYALAILIPSIAVGTRRLHDIGKSGWWQFIALIPILGAIVLIVWFAIDSKEDNKYGKNPKKLSNKNNIVNNNSIDQLEKLANLKEKGLLTEEEFNSKKQELLG